MRNKRTDPSVRTLQLLTVATELSAEHGYTSITREQIAARAGVSAALVSARLGTMEAMRRSVMRHAVDNRILPVIAQGLAAGDKFARRADPEVKQAALATLA